ncbi:hypothetical protein DPMN_004034 [Dreissena polymorpha]|uniref:Uncharacterized protein n=1 Tax=Dreissena polymorpha TaxID=45954 RepID=A0A9D4MR15_DREPO|nr:hypothetical protein DPMN_004034 [Dreissena polymorpha]
MKLKLDFHENWAKNVTSTVFTCFHYIHIEKTSLPSCGNDFSPIWTMFELVPDINETNILTKFHDDWAKIVTSRVFTRKTAPPPDNQHIFKINILTNIMTMDKYWTRNVAPRVFTRQNVDDEQRTHEEQHTTDIRRSQKLTMSTLCSVRGKLPHTPGSHFHDDWAKNVTFRVHVIQLTGTIFQLNSRIKETNVLTKFHENWANNVTSRVFTCFYCIHIEKNAPPTGGYVFSLTIFELVRHINKTNDLINFHDDWAKIVTSRVFTRKTASPTGDHIGHEIFELGQDFIGTKLLTKFHEDGTRNVAYSVYEQMFTDGRTYDGQRPVTKAHLSNQLS